MPQQGFTLKSERPIDQLLEILAYLRSSPEGCAWTKAQTHQSLTPYLIEEAYETAEALDRGSNDAEMCGELGDLLLQIVFHAQIADERSGFNFDDVAAAIVGKLLRRYPTVLGDEANTLKTPEEIDRRWEEIKAQERASNGLTADSSMLDDVSTALPALMRAQKLKDRASKTGWEWPDMTMLLDKIIEEASELKVEIAAAKPQHNRVAAEFGDLMFLMVDFARHHGINAEDALRITNNRFEQRWRYVEKALKDRGLDFASSEVKLWKALWDEAKEAEKTKAPVP